MTMLLEPQKTAELADRIRDACSVTAEFLAEIIDATSRRLASQSRRAKSTRVERLIQAQAWTDAGLALIDLELPQWQVRRIAYDEGEWHCALSRQRELPDWLDSAVEARHANLALAILGALVEARHVAAPTSQTSVPAVPQTANSMYEPMFCDNLG